MNERAFVDTNILIYAHDKREPEKRKIASTLIESLWNSKDAPVISVQVLQEFFVNISRSLKPDEVDDLLDIYKNWKVIDNSLPVFEKAVLIFQKYKFSFWDSMILSSSISSESKLLYTEDLNHGQIIEGVKIINPFIKN
ncbi:MAG: PIN domain-containing protein [Leptospiraceae bacterium]|nr:PIN domain-containing protein [Leptospiraceae bacterium]